MTTPSRSRNKLRIAGLIAGLSVWTALSGIGALSPLAGFVLGLLTYWMLSGILIWAVCSGDTGGPERAPAPADAPQGLPGWLLLVLVISLLVWIGLSGVGGMSGSAGFVFALLAMGGLIGVVIWSNHGGEDYEDHRFALLPEAPQPVSGTDPVPEAPQPAEPSATPAATPAVDGDDLKKIKGITAEIENALRAHGVTRIAQIANWDEPEINKFATNLADLGANIRGDDWVGQARDVVSDAEG